jgi:hypothetical protein
MATVWNDIDADSDLLIVCGHPIRTVQADQFQLGDCTRSCVLGCGSSHQVWLDSRWYVGSESRGGMVADTDRQGCIS